MAQQGLVVGGGGIRDPMNAADFNPSQEFRGTWSLPTAPGTVVGGTLRIDGRRIELELDGAFWIPGDVHEGDSHRYPVVHGISREGKAITLLGAYQTGLSMGASLRGGYLAESLRAVRAVIGEHVDSEFEVTRMRFWIPGIHVWLANPVIERSLTRDEETGFNLFRYRLPISDDLTTRVDSLQADLEWGTHCQDANMLDCFNGISVTVSGWMEMRSDSPQVIDWFLDQQAAASYLLSFLSGTPIRPERIEILREGKPEPLSLHLNYAPLISKSFQHPREFFLDLQSLRIPFQEALNNWFRVFPGIRKPCELAYSIFASDRFFLHIEFLSWMQALDGLHRGLPKDLVPIRGQKRKKPSLQERLTSLLITLPTELRRVLMAADEIPQAWIDSRNYFTHWMENFQGRVLTNAEIFEANIRLKHLTIVILLRTAGIPLEAILKAYEGVSDFARELSSQNAASARRRDPNLDTGLIMSVRPAASTSPAPRTESSAGTSNDEGSGHAETGPEKGGGEQDSTEVQ